MGARRRFKAVIRRPLRVYGSETALRARLRRHLARGRDLLDELELAERRVREVGKRRSRGSSAELSLARFLATYQTERHIQSWLSTSFDTYLPDEELDTPRVVAPRTSRSTALGHVRVLQRSINVRLEWVQALLARIPTRRNVDRVSPEGIRLAELRNSGLVDSQLIDNLERKMTGKLTLSRTRDAIGAAKEIVEATLRATLVALQGSPAQVEKLDFPALAKQTRAALAARAEAAFIEKDRDVIARFQSGFANIESTLAELRNRHGSGHGRPRLGRGLRPRHGRLAIDTAEAYVRFLVTTLDDLQLLPGEGHEHR